MYASTRHERILVKHKLFESLKLLGIKSLFHNNFRFFRETSAAQGSAPPR
nr:MAG TPA: hypothetical protein [Caudoviricetes sp.]